VADFLGFRHMPEAHKVILTDLDRQNSPTFTRPNLFLDGH
jgi:hypothetical protein